MGSIRESLEKLRRETLLVRDRIVMETGAMAPIDSFVGIPLDAMLQYTRRVLDMIDVFEHTVQSPSDTFGNEWVHLASARFPLEPGVTIEMVELWSGKSQARIVVTVTGKFYPWQEGDTLAEARVRAVLAWQDQEGERDDTVGR